MEPVRGELAKDRLRSAHLGESFAIAAPSSHEAAAAGTELAAVLREPRVELVAGELEGAARCNRGVQRLVALRASNEPPIEVKGPAAVFVGATAARQTEARCV